MRPSRAHLLSRTDAFAARTDGGEDDGGGDGHVAKEAVARVVAPDAAMEGRQS